MSEAGQASGIRKTPKKAQSAEIRRVSSGQYIIEYELLRKQVKNINLRVRRDGSVAVSASRRVPAAYIDDFVSGRREFIMRAIKQYDEQRERQLSEGLKPERTYSREELSEIIKLCDEIYPIFKEYGVAYPVIKFRTMKTMWGNCRPQRGIITLNRRLADVPRECAEYVVLHEFAHFIYPNHSKQFYELVEKYMPDWREHRKRLNEN